MLLIKAKFIGENGSLGYLKNGKYHLFFSITKSAQVQIKPIGDSGGKICRYDSLRGFLDNWVILENDQKF